jgi:hypothetical protein
MPNYTEFSAGVSIRARAVRLPDGGRRMQYMLLMYFDEAWDQLSLAARQQIYEEQRR